MTTLVITAVAAEAAAISSGGEAVRIGPYEGLRKRGVTAVPGGVGPTRAAACAGTLLALEHWDLVVSAGIGGAFTGKADVGDLVLADRVVHADLGAESPQGFLPIDALGLGAATTWLDEARVARVATRTAVAVGAVLTVSTVTGTAERAAELTAAHDPTAEGMEGAGVLAAASAHGVPFLELRGISNLVGRRDRDAWDLPAALAALTRIPGGLL
jgi:futalosine hydrolase